MVAFIVEVYGYFLFQVTSADTERLSIGDEK